MSAKSCRARLDNFHPFTSADPAPDWIEYDVSRSLLNRDFLKHAPTDLRLALDIIDLILEWRADDRYVSGPLDRALDAFEALP